MSVPLLPLSYGAGLSVGSSHAETHGPKGSASLTHAAWLSLRKGILRAYKLCCVYIVGDFGEHRYHIFYAIINTG